MTGLLAFVFWGIPLLIMSVIIGLTEPPRK